MKYRFTHLAETITILLRRCISYKTPPSLKPKHKLINNVHPNVDKDDAHTTS